MALMTDFPDLGRSDEDFALQRIVVCGKTFVADASGALYWPGERTLIVADLHLEKGSALAERGSFLPPYDTRTTLGRLQQAIALFEPERVVALGDSLHDTGAAERLQGEDLAALSALQHGRDWVWVTGNHDPEIPECLGGRSVASLKLAVFTLRHEPHCGPVSGEIAAHLHPAACIARSGYRLRRPCFVSNGRRLIMPAFGTYTGGLNVLDRAFMPMFGNEGLSIWMLGHEGIYPIAARQLRAD